MSKCCSCYINKPNLSRYNSKFLGADESQISLFCDYCYVKIEKDEDQLIKMSVENDDNLSTLIKKEYIKNYIDPTSSKCLLQLMKIHKTINEFEGIKKDFVVIELEEYNRYMTSIACSNKKLIDEQKLEKTRQREKEQIVMEQKRIVEIEAKEFRDRQKTRLQRTFVGAAEAAQNKVNRK